MVKKKKDKRTNNDLQNIYTNVYILCLLMLDEDNGVRVSGNTKSYNGCCLKSNKGIFVPYMVYP